jgi:hypothetical protein
MKAHLRYLSYVLRHKWYVFLACLHYRLVWRGIVHDWTKFQAVEWFPYVKFFYGHGMTRGEAAALNYNFPVDDDTELAFEKAWNHHQKRNDHHWQYWIRLGDDGTTLLLDMPDLCRKEMIADWRGAGRALGKPDTLAWYEANKHKMQLHPDTRAWVEAELTWWSELDRQEERLRRMGVIT